MQPWIEKGSSSSGDATKSSLYYDQYLNKQSQLNHTTQSGFRTKKKQETMDGTIHEPLVDGSQVLGFLESKEYINMVYDEEPISYRQLIDSEAGLSNFWTGFIASDDLVAYIEGKEYIDDIYGVPIKHTIQALENDKTNKQALHRLSMIRHHFLQKAQGDKDLAAKQAMTHNDWSQNFFESL